MTSPAHHLTAPVAPRGIGEVECAVVACAADRAAHEAIRRAVFVEEQGVFAGSDLDARDADPRTLHVLARRRGEVAGTVRLYPLDAAGRVWQGDRLAVLPAFRTAGVGAPLVRFAVATAGALGGHAMIAHVQVANEAFFRHLGWSGSGAVEDYVGRPHTLMRIALPRG